MKKLYQGTAIDTKEKADRYRDGNNEVDPYIPSGSLVKAVQLAQRLERPLLLKGEPGCGKSRLAEALAIELHGAEYKQFYFDWNIKSTSKAIDGLYTIDYLKRLRDANSGAVAPNVDIVLPNDEHGNCADSGNYITLNVLGKAFRATHTKDLQNPPVVLIDEIDKADIDFPNDLLYELDKMEFKIPEVKGSDGKQVCIAALPGLNPVFIITSNDEKPLPPAFLRRCLFYYIEFSEVNLEQIVNSKFPVLAAQEGLVADAVKRFLSWRQKISEKGVSTKNMTTSELLDWVKLMEEDVRAGLKAEIEKEGMPSNFQALLKDLESIQIFKTV